MGFVVFGGRPFDHKQNLHLIHILKSNDLTNMINKRQVWLFACLDMALNVQEPDVCCVNHGSIFMGNIYRDRQDITVPDLAAADRNSKEVSVYYKDPSTGGRRRYTTGQLLPNGNMYPNDNFRRHHAD
ncbi:MULTISPECIES: hypothetical protein [unclassified Anaerobiospirillum]|uniref:hypothetical protein n=1 Tax=unclassified Anaerobiospirillum TaxID=2647410 RepID=UPI001FF2BFB2|nr:MULTISPECIES: hypothetical protein [unclassified Anaerobiospirillum]MCK0535568.1 hypothetical protein [Anaerobiospirillum sp. NML120511]MCK0539520.1 hypothetical protein [Anaerobiospirillum sp. NML02-A-032]